MDTGGAHRVEIGALELCGRNRHRLITRRLVRMRLRLRTRRDEQQLPQEEYRGPYNALLLSAGGRQIADLHCQRGTRTAGLTSQAANRKEREALATGSRVTCGGWQLFVRDDCTMECEAESAMRAPRSYGGTCPGTLACRLASCSIALMTARA